MAFFQSPAFLRMPAVGLDISDDAIRFMEFRRVKNELRVSRYATHNLPEGIVTQGHIIDKLKLKERLSSIAKEYHLKYVNVSLPEEQAYLANIKVPVVSPNEIRSVIELHLEEHIPIPGSEAVFDYVLASNEERRRDSLDTVVSVLPRTVVNEYLELFSNTSLIPLGFELESQAIARAAISFNDKGSFMVVDIGKTVTSIFVIARGVVQFAASLDIGGQYINDAITKKLNIGDEEAETMKVKFGIVGPKQHEEMWNAIAKVLQEMRDKIAQHYHYWQTHHGEKFGGAIERIYLSGGAANLNGLSEYLSLGLSVPVSIANPWINVAPFESYIPPIPRSKALSYAVSIGLALRDFVKN